MLSEVVLVEFNIISIWLREDPFPYSKISSTLNLTPYFFIESPIYNPSIFNYFLTINS